jgi:hypothetical protein
LLNCMFTSLPLGLGNCNKYFLCYGINVSHSVHLSLLEGCSISTSIFVYTNWWRASLTAMVVD